MVDVTFSISNGFESICCCRATDGVAIFAPHRVADVGFSLSNNLVAHSGDNFWYSSTLVGGQCRTSDLVRDFRQALFLPSALV